MPAISNIPDFVCFGEILWDILDGHEMPGGAPVNVAYHLKQLGKNPAVITRVGDDIRGRKLKELLAKQGLMKDLVQTDQEYPTGIVNAFKEDTGEMNYEIVSPAAWDHIIYTDGISAAMNESRYFVFGSLSARNHVSADTLFRLLDMPPVNVFDINLRSPHYEPSLIASLLEKANIVKMNHHELAMLGEWWGLSADMQEGAKQIQDRFQIPLIIITKGAKGAAVLDQHNWYEHPGYKVEVADTIGSGDAFLAGFLAERDQGRPVYESLAFAAALGALVASRSGAWPAYTPDDILQLMK